MKRLAAALFAPLLLLFGFASNAANPLPVETLFRLPKFAMMAISPDGAHIAALAPVNGRQNLVVMDVSLKNPRAVTGFDTLDVVDFDWLNSKRLVVHTGSLGTRDFDARGGGIYAVDLDGSAGKQLSEIIDAGSGGGDRLVYHLLSIVRFLPGEGDDFIAQEIVYDYRSAEPGDLFRVDSRTGRRTSISGGKPDSGEGENWVVDEHGVARAFTVSGAGKTRIYYRAGENDPWKKLDEFPSTEPGWMPLAVAEDGKTLYVSALNGGDKAAIMLYDPAKRAFGQIVARHPQVDLTRLVYGQGKVVGVRYNADKPGVAYFDEGLARMQKTVDLSFPAAANRLSWSRDRSLAIITSFSDVSPGTFYLFDVKKGRIEFLADCAPWVKPQEMSHMTPVHYAARDGLDIPAYLTLPRDGPAKHLPMVVVVHGGPWIDGDSWGFDPEVQFLASRGYAVLQPNYRGTTHYGWKHLHSSYGQWGLAMQDDVTDGVKWAVAQGIADPARVCIYGASYGGYATMMGLAKDPDLYRCGIDYVGVTDLPLFLTMTWADYANTDFIAFDAKRTVGDVAADRQRLHDTSPDNLADRIKAPVMMAYGAADDRVPIEHGTRMKAALDRAGVKYQWMVMEGEGHGFRDPANQKAFYDAMAKFLAENLAVK